MKHSELVRRIRAAARDSGKDFTLVREGGNHEIWRCGRTSVPIPRHRELAEGTIRNVQRALEREIGEGWWRR